MSEEELNNDLVWLRSNWDPEAVGFRTWLAGSDRAHKIIARMLTACELEEDFLEGVAEAWEEDERPRPS